MRAYVVLLRGIMPYGRNKVPMATLRAILSEAGLRDIQTYIQTGNIVAKSKLDRAELETLVHDEIREKIGAHIPVIARTAEQLRVAFEQNPFANVDTTRVYFSLLNKSPHREQREKFLRNDFSPDTVQLIGDALYTLYNTRQSDSKFTNSFFEKHLEVVSTSRNFNTMSKLVELSSIQETQLRSW